MARPLKQGLDYFPLDVDIDQDDKFQLVEASHNIEGFGIIIKLLMRIYKEGYFYKWTETEQIIFSRRINVDINTVREVVNDCIKYGIFHQDMYEKNKILTSTGIQKRFFEASKRRKDVDSVDEYLLINGENRVNVNNNPTRKRINVHINTQATVVNADISTQSKVKKRKVKESKNKYAEFVSMTSEEFENLTDTFGIDGTAEKIENLNLYKGSKGVKYKNDYMTILAWERKNKKQNDVIGSSSKPIYKPLVVDYSKGED